MKKILTDKILGEYIILSNKNEPIFRAHSLSNSGGFIEEMSKQENEVLKICVIKDKRYVYSILGKPTKLERKLNDLLFSLKNKI